MPSMVGGFGNFNLHPFKFKNSLGSQNFKQKFTTNVNKWYYSSNLNKFNFVNSQLGPYLAGLIEGDGTFAIYDPQSKAKKYNPLIIIVFNKKDLDLANFLKNLTNCGTVYIKPERGYILWQIQDLVSVFTILNIINGFMRTPKIEALNRSIDWFNNYIIKNKNSKLPKTQTILNQFFPLKKKVLDLSSIDTNSWFAGFSDADSNFSINIHKRSDRNTTRVQLFYRLEIKQTYHRSELDNLNNGYFSIMSKLALFLNVTLYSRTRINNDKQFSSFIVMAHNKESIAKIIYYFNLFPLLSSKYLDYIDWKDIVELQNVNSNVNSYLKIALKKRENFNKTRTTINWDHLKNCYLIS